MLHSRASQILVFTSSHFEINDASTSDSEMVKDLKDMAYLWQFLFSSRTKDRYSHQKLTNAQITVLEN